MNYETMQARLLMSSLAYHRCQYYLNDLKLMFQIIDKEIPTEAAIAKHLISMAKHISTDLELSHKAMSVMDKEVENPSNDNAKSECLRN